MKRVLVPAAVVCVALAAALVATAGPHLSVWSTAQKVDEIAGNDVDLNTTSNDGCPIQSPDGLSLYMASNRPGSMESSPGVRSLDIWVAHREKKNAPFGAPENLGPAINSAADDFCPTPVKGHGLFFVSRRVDRRRHLRDGRHLLHPLRPRTRLAPARAPGLRSGRPNSALDEQGPSYVKAGGQKLLYFSSSPEPSPATSSSAPGAPTGASGRRRPWPSSTAPPTTSSRTCARTVARSSSRRTGPARRARTSGSSSRDSADDPWSPPTKLGDTVNTAVGETRPSLSWDARTLYFGRTPGPEGMGDIYVSPETSSKGRTTESRPNGRSRGGGRAAGPLHERDPRARIVLGSCRRGRNVSG